MRLYQTLPGQMRFTARQARGTLYSPMKNQAMLYDDGRIACDDLDLVIRRYYPWGARRIPYRTIRSVNRCPLTGVRRRWRIWGSGDFRHWWNLDPDRPRKSVALELDAGRWIVPTITPDDPDAVERILAAHMRSQAVSG
jgi:hypothetical protein